MHSGRFAEAGRNTVQRGRRQSGTLDEEGSSLGRKWRRLAGSRVGLHEDASMEEVPHRAGFGSGRIGLSAAVSGAALTSSSGRCCNWRFRGSAFENLAGNGSLSFFRSPSSKRLVLCTFSNSSSAAIFPSSSFSALPFSSGYRSCRRLLLLCQSLLLYY